MGWEDGPEGCRGGGGVFGGLKFIGFGGIRWSKPFFYVALCVRAMCLAFISCFGINNQLALDFRYIVYSAT